MTNEKNAGYYIVSMELLKACEISIGGLGRHRFEPGTYFYVGSAFGGLEARVDRHRKRDKAIRWHVDYLRRRTRFQEGWLFPSPPGDAAAWRAVSGECALAEWLERAGAVRFIRRFGASDCRCEGHLLHVRNDEGRSAVRSLNALNALAHGGPSAIWKAISG